jgi:hypothetical protein
MDLLAAVKEHCAVIVSLLFMNANGLGILESRWHEAGRPLLGMRISPLTLVAAFGVRTHYFPGQAICFASIVNPPRHYVGNRKTKYLASAGPKKELNI